MLRYKYNPYNFFTLYAHAGLDLDMYDSFGQATGEDYYVEPADERRPFRALLDVGLIRTTTGNRVFGALKVCCALIATVGCCNNS